MNSENKCTKFERVCLVDYTIGPLKLVRGDLYITSMEMDGMLAVYLDEPTEDNVVMVFTLSNQFAGAVEIKDLPWEDQYRKVSVRFNTLREKMRLVETQIDKLRYSMHPIVEAGNVRILLDMFDEESGNIKELQDL